MIDNEIIKTLELEAIYCRGEGNMYGPTKKTFVDAELIEGALALINRQKGEIERLEYTLLGVMHSVDKWLDGDELKQDEVNRAATMREKTLQIAERLKNLVEASDKNCKTAIGIIDKWEKQYVFAKAEAVKEFAERLKSNMSNIARMEFGGFTYFCVGYDLIDNLVKEFTEGGNDG